MTIDISKGVYLTTKEIIDYAEKHNLDATDVWKMVINKFCELGATEEDGYTEQSEVDFEYSRKIFKYVGVREDNTTFLHDIYGYFGDDPTPITIDQLFASEGTSQAVKEDTPFQLEVGKVYKSHLENVKIVYREEGLQRFPFVGIAQAFDGIMQAYVGLYSLEGYCDDDNHLSMQYPLEPIPTEHPNVAKIKELEEQINKLKEEMK